MDLMGWEWGCQGRKTHFQSPAQTLGSQPLRVAPAVTMETLRRLLNVTSSRPGDLSLHFTRLILEMFPPLACVTRALLLLPPLTLSDLPCRHLLRS